MSFLKKLKEGLAQSAIQASGFICILIVALIFVFLFKEVTLRSHNNRAIRTGKW